MHLNHQHEPKKNKQIMQFLPKKLLLACLTIFTAIAHHYCFTDPAYASLAKTPVILYTDILSGPNTGGEDNNGVYLSIFGTGFGSTQGSSKVYINNTEVATYNYWGRSQHGRDDVQQITVQPGPSVSSGPIKVVVNGKQSNTDHSFIVKTGDIYFVDNVNGNQKTGIIGDINNPFRYVQDTFALDSFGAGDIIVIRGTGKYWSDEGDSGRFCFIRNKGGTTRNRIKILGYPGESVVIRRQSRHFDFYQTNGYTTLSNIKCDVDGGNAPAIVLGGSQGIRVVNMEITGSDGTDSGFGALSGSGCQNIKVYGNRIHDTGSTSEDPYDRKLFHGTYIDAAKGNPHDVDIGWNYYYNINGGRAIQFFHSSGEATNIRIFCNRFYNINLNAIEAANIPGSGWEIYNNIFQKCGVETYWRTETMVTLNSRSMVIDFHHNTFYAENMHGSLANKILYAYKFNALTLKNNIFYSTDATYQYIDSSNWSNADISNNIYYGAGLAPSQDVQQMNRNPLFVHTGADFHLKSESPAIDAGTAASITKDYDGNPRPTDGDDDGQPKKDIGAYEYIDVDTAPSCPTRLIVR